MRAYKRETDAYDFSDSYYDEVDFEIVEVIFLEQAFWKTSSSSDSANGVKFNKQRCHLHILILLYCIYNEFENWQYQ